MEIIKKNPIWFAIGIGIVFVIAAMYVSEYLFKTFDLWSLIDAYATSLTVFLVFYSWKQNQKQSQPIKIFILKDGKREEIPSYILRKNFVRSDIKGILKELHNSKEDYRIKCLTKPDFLKTIFEIQQGSENELIIEIEKDDFFAYDIKQ